MSDIRLIGGIPSSGSTLLQNLLFKQPGVFCLPETGLFCHGEDISGGADLSQLSPLNRRVPWVNTPVKAAAAMGGTVESYLTWRDRHDDIFAFADDLLKRDGVPETAMVVEKTPENVFAFQGYLAADPNRRVVVVSRRAEEVADSLRRRGMLLLDALFNWFAHGMEIALLLERFPDQVFHCRYDALLEAPEQMAQKAVAFLAGKKRAGRSAVGDEQQRKYLAMSSWRLESSAWRHSPTGPVQRTAHVDMLGVELEMLMDLLTFQVGDRCCALRDLDAHLRDPAARLWSDPDTISRPVPLDRLSGGLSEHLLDYATPAFGAPSHAPA